MKLSIIIVNFNGWHVLETALRSLFAETKGFEYEVIVVDNASVDGSREAIASSFPAVKIVANETNIGFAAANNRGMLIASGQYVLLLNPDTEVLDGALQKTVAFADEHPRAGVVGCRLLYPDRSLQRTAHSFVSVSNLLWEATFLCRLFPRSRVFGDLDLLYFDHDHALQVDWVMGAFFLIRRELIEKIGLLDEQFYMYCEEVDFCFRAKKAGYEVWFAPVGEVLHFWGGMSATSRRVVLWTLGSQMLLIQKHFTGVKRQLMILIKGLGVVLRIPVYAVLGAATQNRATRAKAGYWAFALSQLLTKKWTYKHDHVGPAVPWERV